ncbi:MAG TPA: carboxylesterase, partial [Anaerolineaceae bacterium]|nr:carboxylesterase [Anaerolineaceae bacterium]
MPDFSAALTMQGAEPFLFKGNDTGCLLIHGFTGTPFEMR